MAISFYKDIYELLSKKYPNKKIYVISDQHFYHSKIIEYDRPQFSDVDQMNEYIINAHNSVVSPNDIVIFLGDFSFKKGAIPELMARLNGHKFLLMGNHDKSDLVRKYGACGLEGIFTTPVKMNDTYLSHERLDTAERDDIHFRLLVKNFNANPKGYNYHGHIHTTEPSARPFKNVTCEALDYRPLLIGYTGGLLVSDDSPLIINSDKFQIILEYLKKEKNFDPNLLLTDYIYSTMLEANSSYAGSAFVYGSYALYKKFGYISNFSDLDVALVYNDTISKNRNIQRLKEAVDRMYVSVRDIEGVNVSFIKRIVNMCAFEALYASKCGYYAKCVLDANLIPHNLYRPTDFIQVQEKTTIEKLLSRDQLEMIEGLNLPQYSVQYLTTNGDMANLLLQIIFQKGYNDKRSSALKKLKYVFKSFGNPDPNNIDDLEDTVIRFFLRNILFFYTLRRSSEIDYIKEEKYDIGKLLNTLPAPLAIQLEAIFKNPQSDFNTVFKEITDTSFNDIPQVVEELSHIKK